jgi:membrane protease YdiL (CAAX protease family)
LTDNDRVRPSITGKRAPDGFTSLLLQTTGGFLMAVAVILLYLLIFLVAIISFVCFVLVLVQMFKHDQTGLGIVCIVLTIICGIGPLIAFVYGWMNNKEWSLQKVMLAWTGCVAAQIVLAIIFVGLAMSAPGGAPTQFQQRLDNMQIDDLNVELEPPTP